MTALMRTWHLLPILLVVTAGCGEEKLKPRGDGAAVPDAGLATDAAADEPEVGDGRDAPAANDAGPADTVAANDAVYRREAGTDASRPQGGTGPYHAVAIATGLYHTCALLDDANVKCWGINTSGQLGYGDGYRRGADAADMGDNLPLVDLGHGRFATAIAAGGNATCAILENGAVKCWGAADLVGLPRDAKNNRGDGVGEMGDALPEVNLGDHAAKLVGMGVGAACALLDDGSVKCWGPDVASPTPAMISLGSTTPVSALVGAQKGMLVLFSDGTATRLFPSAQVLGSGVRVTALAGGVGSPCGIVGGVLTCALLKADDPLTGPIDSFFHYGIGDDSAAGGVRDFTGPTPLPPLHGFGMTQFQGACAMFEGGRVGCQAFVSWWPCAPDWCIPSTAAGDGTVFMNLGQPIAALTSGGQEHICGLLANGEVRCWGGNDHPLLPNDALGSSFDMKQVNGQWTYGAFHSIDLGTHH